MHYLDVSKASDDTGFQAHTAPFDLLRERALVISLGDLRAPVAGRDDLIRMKLARGRPIDRADVAALTDPDAES